MTKGKSCLSEKLYLYYHQPTVPPTTKSTVLSTRGLGTRLSVNGQFVTLYLKTKSPLHRHATIYIASLEVKNLQIVRADVCRGGNNQT